jgi:hypothetical protein
MENRTIFQSLDKAWDLLSLFAKEKLTKIKKAHKDNFFMREKRIFDESRNKAQEMGADDNQIKS